MPSTTLVTGAAGFAGSHLLDLLGGEGGGVVAWHRPGGTAAAAGRAARSSPGRRSICSTPRRCIAPSPTSGQPPSTTAPAPRTSGDPGTTRRARWRQRPRHPPSARGADGVRKSRPGSSSQARRWSTRRPTKALEEDDPLVPGNPYALSKLAQEMVGHARNRGRRQVTIARAFNHFGPRQDPFFVASGFARRIADIEAGRWEPEIAGRQPRRTARPHRCARHRSRLPPDPRTRAPRPPLQRLLGPGDRDSRAARPAAGASPRADSGANRSGALSAQRRPADRSAIPPASSPSLAGCRKFRSTERSTTVLEDWRRRANA